METIATSILTQPKHSKMLTKGRAGIGISTHPNPWQWQLAVLPTHMTHRPPKKVVYFLMVQGVGNSMAPNNMNYFLEILMSLTSYSIRNGRTKNNKSYAPSTSRFSYSKVYQITPCWFFSVLWLCPMATWTTRGPGTPLARPRGGIRSPFSRR